MKLIPMGTLALATALVGGGLSSVGVVFGDQQGVVGTWQTDMTFDVH